MMELKRMENRLQLHSRALTIVVTFQALLEVRTEIDVGGRAMECIAIIILGAVSPKCALSILSSSKKETIIFMQKNA